MQTSALWWGSIYLGTNNMGGRGVTRANRKDVLPVKVVSCIAITHSYLIVARVLPS